MNLDFKNINVLLIGDFMIDHYVFGFSNRNSPEAPIPVVLTEKLESIPGGSANVAMNLSALGAKVNCVGCVGDDIWGKKLVNKLDNQGINTDGIEIIKNYKTTLKERIFSNEEQIVRVDTEEIFHWKPSSKISKNYDLVILSDYNKGVINGEWFKMSDYKMVIVDPKKESFAFYKGATIITPNLDELKKASNHNLSNDKSIIKVCHNLISQFDFHYIIAKKGDKGMVVVGRNNFSKIIPAHKVKTPDVTGAGDTTVSALALAYYQTLDIEFSSKFANYIASLSVSKAGTAKVDIKEIDKEIVLNFG